MLAGLALLYDNVASIFSGRVTEMFWLHKKYIEGESNKSIVTDIFMKSSFFELFLFRFMMSTFHQIFINVA